MLAYKGFKSDLTCTFGRGTFQYQTGQTIKSEGSKAQHTGLHCAENPVECLCWYPLGGGNRYFLVEAAGSIDELGGTDTQLACTEMTLLKELSLKEFAGHAMIYMVKHPLRAWKCDRRMLQIAEDEAEADGAGHIAIARGLHPKVRGKHGAVLGLIRDNGGLIEDAKLFTVEGEIKPDTWYTLKDRQPVEVEA